MSDSLCAGCARPAHAGSCYPEIVGPLHARIATLTAEIASLKLQLAAAITHPLAVAATRTCSEQMRLPYTEERGDASSDAWDAWAAAGFLLQAEPGHAIPASAPDATRDRYTLREPVRAIQYDGRYRGARYFAIERMLHEAFGADPDDRRAALTTDPITRENPVAVHTSADGAPGHVVPIRADDYVIVHCVGGEAAAVSVLAEAVFDAMCVAVG